MESGPASQSIRATAAPEVGQGVDGEDQGPINEAWPECFLIRLRPEPGKQRLGLVRFPGRWSAKTGSEWVVSSIDSVQLQRALQIPGLH